MSAYISLSQIHAGDQMCRRDPLLFLDGVLIPRDWRAVRAIAGDDGYIERLATHPDGNFIVNGDELVTIKAHGRVSIKVLG